MPEAYKPIDISNDPEPLKLAEEVHTTHEPRILRHDDEDLAVLIPASPSANVRGRRSNIWKPSAPQLAVARTWILTS
jgi:hypothetical protein